MRLDGDVARAESNERGRVLMRSEFGGETRVVLVLIEAALFGERRLRIETRFRQLIAVMVRLFAVVNVEAVPLDHGYTSNVRRPSPL